MTAPILVPHDLTDLGDAALRAAAELPWSGPRVLLHVLPRIDLRYPAVVWSQQDDEARVAHARKELERRAAPFLPDAVLEVVIGDPGTRIVEHARQLGARLVVIPSHGRRGVERFVLGSVAEHVARFAPCPVMILPAGASPTRAHAKERHVATGRTRTELMEELSTEICAAVDAHRGAFLTALRVGLPAGEDAEWWERALEKRLAEAGIEFVDLVFSPNPRPAVLSTRFEQRWT